MAEEAEEGKKPGFNVSVNLEKWLPYILIAGGWLINFGRNSSSNDALNNQVQADKATIADLTKNIQSLNVALAELKITIEDMRREEAQDRLYRENTNKNK